jgi:hypothetical protein
VPNLRIGHDITRYGLWAQKELGTIDGIEGVGLIAKITTNLDGFPFGQDRFHFGFAQHFQHPADAFAGTPAGEVQGAQITFLFRFLPKQTVQDFLWRNGTEFGCRDRVAEVLHSGPSVDILNRKTPFRRQALD